MPKKPTELPATRGQKVLRTTTRDLLCPLSPSEVRAKAEQLSARVEELKAHDADAKLRKAELKSKRDQLNADIYVLAEAHKNEEERRPVAVQEEADYRRGLLVCIRLDTGEVLEEKPLQAHERQQDMDLDEEGESSH